MTDSSAAHLQTQLTDRMRGSRWSRIEVVESIGSTNADLVARASGDPAAVAGHVLIALEQTAGRGRHTRAWESPAGAQLAMSVAVGVPRPTAALGWLSLLAGIAVSAAIEEVCEPLRQTPGQVNLKWPNDVLIDDRKVAGILAEFVAAGAGDGQAAGSGTAVIGLGINTAMTEEQFPVPTATSLSVAAGQSVDHADLAVAVLTSLDDLLTLWPDRLPDIATRYRAQSGTLGSQVKLILPGDKEIVGVAEEIDAAGRIVVNTGSEKVVAAAGDVTHLR
ncbi:biotin--[acetyl-CoA-carboxylase] ligase [Gordonia sp. TBRC 11910]|uniref:biotin--[biotin carboxyl-carrier protein] ligase n=1 Tax=Gordonia asplenii TaxID=2725283 RepID=A0A848KY38_9ACTN|nr:biotin--[acetyl-CoA-carboxylase] ligase [Gordonia asplenii]NMO01131.1 biotin--[acetyl-CoA-carboxylase] ligase [Gordonia asplenii]